MAKLSADEQYELITRNLEEVVGEDDIKKTLAGNGVTCLFLVVFKCYGSFSFYSFIFDFRVEVSWRQIRQSLAW